MEFKADELNLRIYQQAILGTAVKHNTLIVIPTGLGKTFIAIALAGLQHEKGKILMLAPTKPLCVQHKKTFSEFFEPSGELVVMTGAVAPEERKKLWKEKSIFFATPQAVENDMLRRYLDPNDFSLVVFDEAHRATGDYAYVWLAEQFSKNKNVRLMALTASPASDKETLNEICDNLRVSKVEVRSPQDLDVAPYVKEKKIKRIDVELPEKLKEVKKILEDLLKQRLSNLKKKGLITSSSPSKVRKMKLLKLQGHLSKNSDTEKNAYRNISLIAECLKIQHALLLLQTQGVSPLVDFFKKLEKQASKTKAAKRLVNNWQFKKAMIIAYDHRGEVGEHPKFKALKDLVKEYAGKRIIVFAQYRSSVKKIVSALGELEGVKPHRFIGQTKGMSQKAQINTIRKFRDGEVNVLVCTNIGEEGLDIPKVPLGILFEPVPSALRSIQRVGRVGRTNIGEIYILVTKDTLDEKYYWVAKHKERRMNQILDDLKDELSGKQTSLSDF